jgi:protease-4
MGNVAGSGGYYVAIPGEQIFAEATTVTGSIGVVGGKLVWNELFEDKLGITTTEFSRGDNADLWSQNRRWTEAEEAEVQAMLDDIYSQFKGRVMQSRGDRIKGELEPLAGGRVYTGRQALEIGLVDQIGGLNDAIAYAANKVGLDDPDIYTLPKQKDFAETLMELFGEPTADEFEISIAGAVQSDPLLRRLVPLINALAPQLAETIKRDLLNLSVIQRERVGLFMPLNPTIR